MSFVHICAERRDGDFPQTDFKSSSEFKWRFKFDEELALISNFFIIRADFYESNNLMN